VLISQIDIAAGSAAEYSMDKWAGYQADATALVDFLARRKPSNAIVLTGDIHSNCLRRETGSWAARVRDRRCRVRWRVDLFRRRRPGAAAAWRHSFPTTPTSASTTDNAATCVARSRRRWQADYRIVPFVTNSGVPVETRANFVVENGRPGAERT
jgi:alkaline phosphatase D